MRVFILSLLAVSSVHSHAIRYPYHGQLLSYTPARGEFPVYNDLALGYVRYFDSNGAERLVRYNYPEPLYGVRRFSYGYGSNQGNQLLRTHGGPEAGFSAESYYQIQDTDELAKAREEHFRRWCEKRYQALKAEMDKLRAEGLRPSSDMMAQLKPLEKIISSTTYTAFSESPEIQRIRDEHLRIWNEARLKVLQQEADHLRFNHGVKQTTTQFGINEINANQNAIIGETAEQKQAREEHLRIYNEQLANLKRIEAEQKQQQGNWGIITVKEAQEAPNFAVKSSYEQGIQHQLQDAQLTASIAETPEVIKAREEHLRIYNEQLAKLKQLEANKSRYYFSGSQQTTAIGSEYNTKPEVVIGETAEQQKVREEHFRLYNEQLAKVKQLEASQKLQQGTAGSFEVKDAQQTYGKYQEVPSLAVKSSFQEVKQQQTAPIGDTPEVIKAREEHLRLVNEAKLRAQTEGSYNTKDDGSYKAAYQAGSSYKADEKLQQTPILRIIPAVQQPVQNIGILQTEQRINQGIQPEQSSLLKTTTSEQQSQIQQPVPVQDTPEVTRAREEHLRIVNEVKSMAAQWQQDKKQLDSNPALLQQTDKAQIYSATIDDAEKLREEESLREEQRIIEAERLREAERMSEEEKMRDMERLREIERQKEEEKMLEAERLRLKEEEAKRMEMERLNEEKRLKEEQEKQISMELSSSGIVSGISSDLLGSQLKTQQGLELKTQQGSESGSSSFIASTGSSNAGIVTGSGTGFVLSSQFKNNPYLIRFASQPDNTAYVIGDQQQVGIKTDATRPNLYYLPAQKEGPLYLRYTHSGLKSPNAVQQVATATLTGGSSEKISTYSSSSSSSGSSASTNLKVSYGATTETSTGLSELEKATRDHFRAHELALEQLRLANLKTPYTKDC